MSWNLHATAALSLLEIITEFVEGASKRSTFKLGLKGVLLLGNELKKQFTGY
jgi:hypothetical protein